MRAWTATLAVAPTASAAARSAKPIQSRKITIRRLLQRNHQRPRLPQRGDGKRSVIVFSDTAEYSAAQ